MHSMSLQAYKGKAYRRHVAVCAPELVIDFPRIWRSRWPDRMLDVRRVERGQDFGQLDSTTHALGIC